jgi:RNA polymerase sigma factor (sigma-70 family)
LLSGVGAQADAQLLESFLTQQDEAAFEGLLRRHGPMVLGVCRRVLRDPHAAEDAFQATFLVLVRKASTIRPLQMVGPWLYGVAYRTALKARAMTMKRRAREKHAGQTARWVVLPADDPPEELLAELDAALNRLPEKYRVPIVLCELEGKRRKEVAGMLGLPEGTVASRVAYAKKLLAKRLARFGAGFLGAALSADAASACVPPSLRRATARAALHLLGGQALTAGVVSMQVVTLTEGVLKVMLLNKLKTMWLVVLALLVGAGAIGLTYRTAMAQPGRPSDASPVTRASADELEELRLEVAALRKGLEATRQRVKVLEGEVQTLRAGRSQSGGLNQAPGHQPAATPFQRKPGAPTDQPQQWFSAPSNSGKQTDQPQQWFSAPGNSGKQTDQPQQWFSAPREGGDGPLADAEAALKKLRANPNDKEAADALDRALQQLKERQGKRPAP